ncbi:MAG: hypothetical protein CL607_17970, partial [Anaerolineaceae bacterium]|nr:hypothetical protein [Anaerolineaceae bacterium]
MRSVRLGLALFLFVLLSFVVIDVSAQITEIKVNFQDAATVPPTGYLRDSGEAYGVRNAADQGGGTYTYGWVQPGTSTPANSMTTLGRNRATSQADLRLDTLMHMDHPNEGEPGYWQIIVPNGLYE